MDVVWLGMRLAAEPMTLALRIALCIVALNVAGAIVLSIVTTIHDWRKSRCKHDGYRECAECQAWLDGAETEIYRGMEVRGDDIRSF